MKLRAPAVPLITVDPFFSVWSPDTILNAAPAMHWTGKRNSLIGIANIDGVEYSFLGHRDPDLYKMKQISLDISALTTKAVFENEKIRLTMTLTTPLLPNNTYLLSRPVSYMALSYDSLDGYEHSVTVKVSASEELCLDKPLESPVETENLNIADNVIGIRMGNTVQNPVNRSGDDHRINWGYFYVAAKSENATASSFKYRGQTVIAVSAPMKEGTSLLYLFAYDDVLSLEYFGTKLKAYWKNSGKTITDVILEAANEYDELIDKCEAFSSKMFSDAEKAGGEKYAEILSLAYRQVIAGHKLALDDNAEIIFISKECFSNGCAGTVDVSYPSIPMFLLYNPELIKGMMRPIYRYADSEEWKCELKYDFAPHDVGVYPILSGQFYGKTDGKLDYNKQMPVEECGNMLIMEANVALATKNADFAASHFDVLKSWCEYLIKYGNDPENQLCTDDFAGHLAHNCNLSLKAIMGIEAMAILCDMLNYKSDAVKYRRKARKMAKVWMTNALNEDGTSKLAFDKPGTYSMKYNMVWDKLWETKIFKKSFVDYELKSNLKHFNKYGMPLDTRADYTKSDWIVWTASMASSKKLFESYIEPLWRAYNESNSHVPLTDWYDTVTSRSIMFQHRTVQGGLFMKLLMNKWTEK